MSLEAQQSGKGKIDLCISLSPRRLEKARGGASFSFAIFRTFFYKCHSILFGQIHFFLSSLILIYMPKYSLSFSSRNAFVLGEYNLELPSPFEIALVFCRPNLESQT